MSNTKACEYLLQHVFHLMSLIYILKEIVELLDLKS